MVVEEGIELLRLIYNEAKDEFDTKIQNKSKNEDDGKNVSAIFKFRIKKKKKKNFQILDEK